MPAHCPFCAEPTVSEALVCGSCSRDIAIPETLIAERDDLLRKRALASEELAQTKAELDALRRRQRIPLRRS